MGIIARQATRNLVFIIIGFLAGAVNTLIVLPNAFETFPEGWGTLRLLIAAFMILSQLFSFGATNIIIKYYNSHKDKPGGVLRFALWTALLGTAILTIVLLTCGESLSYFFFKEEARFIVSNLHWVGILSGVYILFLMFQGYVNAILKSSFHQFLNETFLKGYYLCIAVLFLFGYLNFDQLILAFVGGYVLALFILAIYSVAQGYSLKGKSEGLPQREMTVYGTYSILDKGANTIVNHLDVIMIGMLSTVSDVGYYALAAYIGTVTQMPQRAILAIANPIASKALAENDHDELKNVYYKSCRDQLILGGLIFLGAWVSIDELMSLMPGKFGQGKWVVLFIGLSKLFYMASGVSGGIIVYSKFFRTNLWFNLTLIGLTILTNYLFISPQHLDMGIEGAALATAISFFVYNVAKMIFIQGKWRINPIDGKVLLTMVLIGLLALIHSVELPLGAIAAIAIKSLGTMLLFAGLVYFLKISPDINAQVKKLLRLN